MNILVACEESQRVCAAFRAKGHNAFSCDVIEESGGFPQWHIRQDVLPLLGGNCSFTTCDGVEHNINGKWDMIIAFPPCTYMSKAGARWLYPTAGVLDEERYKKALAAKDFFMAFYNADCEKIVIENPTPLKVVGLPPHSQVIQPYLFDSFDIHPYTKRTLLWLKGVKPLESTTPTTSQKGLGCRQILVTIQEVAAVVEVSRTMPERHQKLSRVLPLPWQNNGVELWHRYN